MDTLLLKLLLTGFLIVNTTALQKEINQSDQLMFRLPKYIIPLHYNINFKSYAKQSNDIFNAFSIDQFEGSSTINIHILHTTRSIHFHMLNLYIYNALIVLINEGLGKIYKPITDTYNAKTHIYSIYFTEMLLPGYYTLNLKFISKQLHEKEAFLNVLYKSEEGNVKRLSITRFPLIGARQIFPCWDVPTYKTTFNISIQHHKKYNVLSNMPVQKISDSENGMTSTHFHTTPVLPTYLIAIAMTNFPNHHCNSGYLENHIVSCRKEITNHLKYMQEILKSASMYIKTTWSNLKKIQNIWKIDHIIIPDFQNISNWHFRDGMSNWGLISYRESEIIYNKQLYPFAKKLEISRSVAYKMIHHWFGNLVSPSWWSSLWINDGITILFATEALDTKFATIPMWNLFVVQYLHDSLNLDTNFFIPPLKQDINAVSHINSLFTTYPYIKAPVIFRMLQHALTDVIFREGINFFYLHNQFKSITANDLWDAMEQVQNHSNKQNFQVKANMDAWIEKSNYPIVNAVQNYKNGIVTISQEENFNTWSIPITYTTQIICNFANTTPMYWLGPNTKEINISNIESFDWFIINLQQTGYYRVNYDWRNWQRIIQYLNTDRYKQIHVLNRAQIIDDLFYFTIENKVNVSLFWNLKTYLALETDYTAWYPVFKVFEYLSTFIQFSQIKFEKQMRKFLPDLLKKIGYKESPLENELIKCLRQEAAKWACALDDTTCQKHATVILNDLINKKYNKVLPWWEYWVYCNGLKIRNGSTWMTVLNMYKKNPDKKILEYLTCSRDPFVVRMYLDYLSSETIIIKDRDYINTFLQMITKHGKIMEVFEYILEHFEKLKRKCVHPIVPLVVILNHAYTKDREHMIISKFKSYFNVKDIINTINYKYRIQTERFQMLENIIPYEEIMLQKIDDEEQYEEIYGDLNNNLNGYLKNGITNNIYLNNLITNSTKELLKIINDHMSVEKPPYTQFKFIGYILIILLLFLVTLIVRLYSMLYIISNSFIMSIQR